LNYSRFLSRSVKDVEYNGRMTYILEEEQSKSRIIISSRGTKLLASKTSYDIGFIYETKILQRTYDNMTVDFSSANTKTNAMLLRKFKSDS